MLQIVSVTVMYKFYEINFVVYSNIFDNLLREQNHYLSTTVCNHLCTEKNVFKLKRKWLVYVYWVYSFVFFLSCSVS